MAGAWEIRGLPKTSYLQRLAGADESADELSLDASAFLCRERSYRCACPALSDLLQGVASCDLYLKVDKPCLVQQSPVGMFLQRPSKTSSPCLKVLANSLRDSSLKDDIRNRKSAAWCKHPVGFAQHLAFIGRQIDDAVGNHHVYSALG